MYDTRNYNKKDKTYPMYETLALRAFKNLNIFNNNLEYEWSFEHFGKNNFK